MLFQSARNRAPSLRFHGLEAMELPMLPQQVHPDGAVRKILRQLTQLRHISAVEIPRHFPLNGFPVQPSGRGH